MADLSGQQLGPYRLQRKLGQGGMGAVYLGIHQTLQTSRAIKVLLPSEADEAVVERFVREGVISASLRHPNIVEIFDVGEQDEMHFLVMELVDGESLLHVLRASGALPLERAVGLLRQIAAALDYAHARGVVHRDVKPSNIIVEPDDQVTLIDFGIARAMDASRMTRVGVVVGTFEYMAPEVVTEGGGSPGADRYALGIVAYQMLTGRVPFTGESAHSIMYRQVHDPPPPPGRFRPDLPEAAEAALLRQLLKEPDGRFPSAQAFVDALEASISDQSMQTEATAIADITRPGFDRPTRGSGQTPVPRSGRVTRPVTAATLTPPGAQALPSIPQPSTAPHVDIPPAPGTVAAPVIAARGEPRQRPAALAPNAALTGTKKSSALPTIGIGAAVAALLLAVVLLSPLQQSVAGLFASAPPATATVVAAQKSAVTPVVAVTPAGAVASVPKPAATTAPPAATTGPAVQPKPGITPAATTVPTSAPTAAPTLAPTLAPTTPPAPPTLTPGQRLGQAREASAAGNHPSALALLGELRQANPALAGLDDTQYEVHMAFARSLLDAGNLDASYEQFGAAMSMRPNDSEALAGQRQIVLTKNYAAMEAAWNTDQERAIALLEENMRLDAGFRETRSKLYALLIMKADRLLDTGERDAAFPVLMRALDVQPANGEAQQRLVSYTPTPVPTATPRPYVPPPPQSAPPSSGGSTYAPAPSGGSGSSGTGSSSGGSSCPGGVCP